jgi:hypothetical protein
MAYQRIKVLIWGKTYPELSKRYTETVCTGGCLEDGRPIRLYPVPLRYLGSNQQYKLYDWVEVPVEKNPKDPRKESFKVRSDDIRLVGSIDTDANAWRARRAVVFRDTSWHFESLEDLQVLERRGEKSIGVVTPGEILGVRTVARTAADRREYDEKMAEIQDQTDIFRPEYKELEFLPYEIHLRWRCTRLCSVCRKSPHDMKVLDWGLLQLARKSGWESACRKLEEISNPKTHEFRLFMGNFHRHPKNFGILGLWYPKIPEQQLLI